MQDVSKGDGRTVLFVSHNMGAVKSLCKSGIVLNNGEISFSGNIDDSVNYYLRSTKDPMSLSLFDRQDRIGNQKIKGKSIYLKSLDNELIDFVTSGHDFKICLEYENASSELHQNVLIGFSLTDINESPLLLIHSRLTGDEINIKGNSGVFECIVNRLPLNEGTYLLSYSIMIENGRDGYYDSINNVFDLKVIKGNFYKTGEIAPSNFGPLLLDAKFEIK